MWDIRVLALVLEFTLFGYNIQIHAIKMKYLCYILRNINNAMKTMS